MAQNTKDKKRLVSNFLLGNEAAALGAIHAGIVSAYAYPGTPSTEAMEYLINYSKTNDELFATWCTNEKASYEQAVGASLVGKRSLVIMKHVGLNVAADPFMSSALIAINGGLVICVADDPGMHSSQNEQDTRVYAAFANVFCFEPSDHQEAYDMTIEAFKLSEKYKVPVLVRLTTRIAHTRSIVSHFANGDTNRGKNAIHLPKDKENWITLPAYSRKMYAHLVEQQEQFHEYSDNSRYNALKLNDSFREYGVVTTGIGKNYFDEYVGMLQPKPSHLHIGVYPIPLKKINALCGHVRKILVIEEGSPYVEKKIKELRASSLDVHGKENKGLPFCGELTPESVAKFVQASTESKNKRIDQSIGTENFPKCSNCSPKLSEIKPLNKLPKRIPSFCLGCPHIDTFMALQEAIHDLPQALVTSDIGCYGLGAFPPLSVLDTMLCMGASIGMAKGASEAGFHPVIATIGDSTFLHSGIQPLIDAVNNKTNITVIIMDNSTVAMTGAQDTTMPSSQIEQLILGVGIEPKNMHVITPLEKNLKENTILIKRFIEISGVSVIISRRPCVKIRGAKR